MKVHVEIWDSESGVWRILAVFDTATQASRWISNKGYGAEARVVRKQQTDSPSTKE